MQFYVKVPLVGNSAGSIKEQVEKIASRAHATECVYSEAAYFHEKRAKKAEFLAIISTAGDCPACR